MPDKHEVGGSSPLGPTSRINILQTEITTNHLLWGCSSVGRAPALQAGGHGFESHHLHHGTQVPTNKGLKFHNGVDASRELTVGSGNREAI